MRTTLDIPDPMLRRVKSKCALEGLTMRGVAMLFFQDWIDGGPAAMHIVSRVPLEGNSPEPRVETASAKPKKTFPPWFGIVKVDPTLPHDMESIRKSVAEGRKAEWAERERRIREGVG